MGVETKACGRVGRGNEWGLKLGLNFPPFMNNTPHNNILCTIGWPRTMKCLPKYVGFTNFEQFWIAEIILHQSYLRHFCVRHCLRVAHLILSLAYFCIIPKENILFEELSLLRLCVSTLPRKRITWNTMFSFGVMQNFRSNARPLNSGLEKNA